MHATHAAHVHPRVARAIRWLAAWQQHPKQSAPWPTERYFCHEDGMVSAVIEVWHFIGQRVEVMHV